jgi:hypothetical protein
VGGIFLFFRFLICCFFSNSASRRLLNQAIGLPILPSASQTQPFEDYSDYDSVDSAPEHPTFRSAASPTPEEIGITPSGTVQNEPDSADVGVCVGSSVISASRLSDKDDGVSVPAPTDVDGTRGAAEPPLHTSAEWPSDEHRQLWLDAVGCLVLAARVDECPVALGAGSDAGTLPATVARVLLQDVAPPRVFIHTVPVSLAASDEDEQQQQQQLDTTTRAYKRPRLMNLDDAAIVQAATASTSKSPVRPAAETGAACTATFSPAADSDIVCDSDAQAADCVIVAGTTSGSSSAVAISTSPAPTQRASFADGSGCAAQNVSETWRCRTCGSALSPLEVGACAGFASSCTRTVLSAFRSTLFMAGECVCMGG